MLANELLIFFRFSTGIQINTGICKAYIYAEYLLFQILLVIFVLETVVHYIFIKRVTFLLIVKEDLIMAILWRGAIAVGLCSTFVKFCGKISDILSGVYPDFSRCDRVILAEDSKRLLLFKLCHSLCPCFEVILGSSFKDYTHCLNVATFWSCGWKEDFHSK